MTAGLAERRLEGRPEWWTVVAAMWERGASPHTIAAALNRGPWAADGQRQWHWRQIVELVAPPQAPRSRHRDAADSVDRDGSAVLHALEVERERQIDLATRIGLYLERGESSATIAARLNGLGLRTERGTRWTGIAVDAFIGRGIRRSEPRPRAIVAAPGGPSA